MGRGPDQQHPPYVRVYRDISRTNHAPRGTSIFPNEVRRVWPEVRLDVNGAILSHLAGGLRDIYGDYSSSAPGVTRLARCSSAATSRLQTPSVSTSPHKRDVISSVPTINRVRNVDTVPASPSEFRAVAISRHPGIGNCSRRCLVRR